MEALVKLTKESLSTKQEFQLRQILRREYSFSKGTSQMTKDQLVDKILSLSEEVKQDNLVGGFNSALVYKDNKLAEWKISHTDGRLMFLKKKDGYSTNILLTAFANLFTATKYHNFSEDQVSSEKEVVEETVQDEQEGSTQVDLVESIEEIESETTLDVGIDLAAEGSESVAVEQDVVVDECPVDNPDILQPAEVIEESTSEVPGTAAPIIDMSATEEPLVVGKVDPVVAKKKMSKSDIVRKIIRTQYKDPSITMTSGTVMKALEEDHDMTIHRSFCSSLITKMKALLDG